MACKQPSGAKQSIFHSLTQQVACASRDTDPDVAPLIRATNWGRGLMAIASLHPFYGPYSAACLTCRAVGVRIVTSSSAAVGCNAMVASKSALVAFIFTAMATAWTISAAVSPTM